MGIFSSLNRKQKEAAAILQIGTFLEYFDLMLYVHMSVILNELFFPKTDPHVAQLIAAMSFCSTFVLRPFGALFFGYVGDTFGRKHTVIITTFMMAISCVFMAVLPTYAQIGIVAAWGVTLCRIFQGLSSMGEMVGASLYLTELIPIPARYPIVSFLGCADCLGTVAALAVAAGVLVLGLEWRFAFLIGALIATVGMVARTALKETPEFANAKIRIKKKLEEASLNNISLEKDPIFNQKVNLKTVLAYFFISCSRPVCLYFIYIYCSSILKYSFHYTPLQIIKQNFILAIVEFIGRLFFAYLSYIIHPLKIVKVKLIIFSTLALCAPYLLSKVQTPDQLLVVQSFLCFFTLSSAPAAAVLFLHFPVFKRFTYASFIYSLSRALMYVIVSFGLVYLTKNFDYWGLLLVFVPLLISFKWGINHFEILEAKEVEKNNFQGNNLNYLSSES